LVHSLVSSPREPATWIAATKDGIWRSRDDGESWTQVGLAGHLTWAAAWAPDGVHAFATGLPGTTVAASSDAAPRPGGSSPAMVAAAGSMPEAFGKGQRSRHFYEWETRSWRLWYRVAWPGP